MKQSTKDEAAGKFHQIKGRAKEKIGKMTGKRRMEDEGRDERVSGNLQEKIGQVEKVFEP